MSSNRINQWALAALWMRAVANGCGYTPETARPLGLGYALARRYPRRYERERLGSLEFAGLEFYEPTDGRVIVNGESYRALDYERTVVPAFRLPQEHHSLFYVAADSAELFPIEKADQTDVTWRRFNAELCGRQSLSLGLARELLGGLRP